MKRIFVFVAIAIATTASNAAALTSCKAKVDKKDGTIYVYAAGVSTNLAWGADPGSVNRTFSNQATCLVGSAAARCTFDTPGTELAKTPPSLCTVFLEDDQGTCSAFVSGCTPGYRIGTQQNGASEKWVRVGASSWGNPIDLGTLDGGDATMADLGANQLIAPEDGVYQVSGWIEFQIAGDSGFTVKFVNQTSLPADLFRHEWSFSGFGGYRAISAPVSFVAHLNKGDHIQGQVTPAGGFVSNGSYGPANVVLNMALVQ